VVFCFEGYETINFHVFLVINIMDRKNIIEAAYSNIRTEMLITCHLGDNVWHRSCV